MLYTGSSYIHAISPFVISDNISKLLIKNKEDIKVLRLIGNYDSQIDKAMPKVIEKILSPYNIWCFVGKNDNAQICTKLVAEFYEEVTGKKIDQAYKNGTLLFPDYFLKLIDQNLVSVVTDNNKDIFNKIDCIDDLHPRDRKSTSEIILGKLKKSITKFNSDHKSDLKKVGAKNCSIQKAIHKLEQHNDNQQYNQAICNGYNIVHEMAVEQIKTEVCENSHFYDETELFKYLSFYKGEKIRRQKFNLITLYPTQTLDNIISYFYDLYNNHLDDNKKFSPYFKDAENFFLYKFFLNDYFCGFLQDKIVMDMDIVEETRVCLIGAGIILNNHLNNIDKIINYFSSYTLVDDLYEVDKFKNIVDIQAKSVEIRYKSAVATAQYLSNHYSNQIGKYIICDYNAREYLKIIIDKSNLLLRENSCLSLGAIVAFQAQMIVIIYSIINNLHIEIPTDEISLCEIINAEGGSET